MRFAASLTPVSTNFLRQESAPSDYLQQATCVTLGVVFDSDATQLLPQNAERNELAAALNEVTLAPSPSVKGFSELHATKGLQTPGLGHSVRMRTRLDAHASPPEVSKPRDRFPSGSPAGGIDDAEKQWKLQFHEWSTKYIVDWKHQFDFFVRNQQARCDGGDGGGGGGGGGREGEGAADWSHRGGRGRS